MRSPILLKAALSTLNKEQNVGLELLNHQEILKI